MAALPEVPALAETLPDYELVNWFGLFAPAGTPPDRIAALNTAVANALRDPALAAKLLDQGAEAAPMSVADFARFVASESATFGRIIREGNIRAEDGRAAPPAGLSGGLSADQSHASGPFGPPTL